MANLNKWTLDNGTLTRTKEATGKTASDLSSNMIHQTFDNMEQPIVDSLIAKDKQVIEARQSRMAENIDRKRIEAVTGILGEAEDRFIDFLIEASQQSEEAIKTIEAEVVEKPIVGRLSFGDKLAQRLGGAITTTPNQAQLESSDDFADF